jgi:dihydrofolate reductase
MAKLIYSAIASLDGYIEDEEGSFAWAAPGEELHAFVNDLERSIGTYLYGRRMYETMAVWETDPSFAEDSEITRDYAAIWQAAEKVVYSTTLESASTARTQVEREFDPDPVRAMKDAADTDLSIGGPALAAEAFRAGLIDECHLFVTPIIVGGGKPSLPSDLRLGLELLGEDRFAGGVVHLHYRVLPT